MNIQTNGKLDAILHGKLLTIRQVLEMWPISRATLNRMSIKFKGARRIPSYRVGGRRMYKFEELMYWLDNNKEPESDRPGRRLELEEDLAELEAAKAP